MKEGFNEQYYNNLLTFSYVGRDPNLQTEIEQAKLLSLLQHPQQTEALIPPLIRKLQAYMVPTEQCTLPENLKARKVIENYLSAFKTQIRSFGVAVLYGSVAYDVPNNKDVDVIIYTNENRTNMYLKTVMGDATHSIDAKTNHRLLELMFVSMEDWYVKVTDTRAFSHPDHAANAYYSCINVLPLLYGLHLVGEDSMYQAMQEKVLFTAQKNPLVSASLVSSMLFIKNKIEKRRLRQPQEIQ